MTDLREFWVALKSFSGKLLSETKTLDVLVVFVGFVIGFYLNWPISAVVAFGLLVWTILNPISSRLAAKGSAVLLGLLILLLGAGKADRAESIAALAYYFLVITVIMAVVEIRRGADENDQSKN